MARTQREETSASKPMTGQRVFSPTRQQPISSTLTQQLISSTLPQQPISSTLPQQPIPSTTSQQSISAPMPHLTFNTSEQMAQKEYASSLRMISEGYPQQPSLPLISVPTSQPVMTEGLTASQPMIMEDMPESQPLTWQQMIRAGLIHPSLVPFLPPISSLPPGTLKELFDPQPINLSSHKAVVEEEPSVSHLMTVEEPSTQKTVEESFSFQQHDYTSDSQPMKGKELSVSQSMMKGRLSGFQKLFGKRYSTQDMLKFRSSAAPLDLETELSASPPLTKGLVSPSYSKVKKEVPASHSIIKKELSLSHPTAKKEVPAYNPMIKKELSTSKPEIKEDFSATNPVIKEELPASQPIKQEPKWEGGFSSELVMTEKLSTDMPMVGEGLSVYQEKQTARQSGIEHLFIFDIYY